MAVELIRHSDSRIDRQQLAVFINSYQRVAPLTIGELWAWPSMLKLALIENLRRLAAEAMEARGSRQAADTYVARMTRSWRHWTRSTALPSGLGVAFVVQLLHRIREYGLRLPSIRSALEEHLAARETTAEVAIRGELQRQATAQESVANAITSLRFCSRSTGASISSRSAWSSRRCSAILPGRTGTWTSSAETDSARPSRSWRPQRRRAVRVGLRAIESARQAAAANSHSARAAHVGYHLIDRGRRDLEADVAYRPDSANGYGAWSLRTRRPPISAPSRS